MIDRGLTICYNEGLKLNKTMQDQQEKLLQVNSKFNKDLAGLLEEKNDIVKEYERALKKIKANKYNI